MSNPIPNTSMFATPESFKELEERLNLYSGSEAGVAWTAAMMALNLAHKLVEDAKQAA